MKSWEEDLLSSVGGTDCEHEIFRKLQAAAHRLGFEHCAYGLRFPLPLSNPRTFLLNDYPSEWQARYQEAGYLAIDPTVQHGRRTHAPLIWTDEVFAHVPALWHEARSFGLQVGWAQSSLDANGVGGMLTLSRSGDSMSASELEANEVKMRWLVNIAHLCLVRVLAPRLSDHTDVQLSGREIEVLKWTGDGKTSGEIAEILLISVDTVNFHVKNAIIKLRTANKTAAVVRAAMLGLLS